ncbi:inosine-uridine preferring nucleoside hydrolase [Moniliophthora roreri MCA 2997]|uniref:Inosine-uridine preferring nucleoside hydrolase n=1 Tax=Moniliophthora roreri (strain MCA 2997) TaxID=1381753 RepID=V2XBD6_MONRO|nr:inosine-uridine preferring nucleoside hydrolase [Moniliophthora roreri MCA 2997]
MNKTQIIIDTDPGVDDIIALLFALASPEIEILAIIVSYGNTDLEASFLNVLKAYHALETHLKEYPEHEDRYPNFFSEVNTILAKGCAGPFHGPLVSAQYFHGRDGLGDISRRHPELLQSESPSNLQMTDKHGVEIALDLMKVSNDLGLTYVTLGPLTNFAVMIHRDRNLVVSKVGRVVCMGGALDVPGNTSPVAEFNFFADPYAVKEILCTGQRDSIFPLDRFLLLPLDITTPHELPFPVYRDRVDNTFEGGAAPSIAASKQPLVHFTSSFLERTRDVMLKFGKDALELHDIVAVWCAICNPPSMPLAPGWEEATRLFDIERTGELTRGMLVIDRREDETAYAPGANRAEVQARLDDQACLGLRESTAIPARVEVAFEEQIVFKAATGVRCITETPGPNVLLDLLLKRVWNV